MCKSSPSVRTASVSIESSFECDRTIGLAIVDNQLVNPHLEPLFWRIEHVPAGCQFEVRHQLSGEFGIRIAPVGYCGTSYTAQRVNRLGTTTTVTDNYSALQIHQPVVSSQGNKYDVKVHNASRHAIEVTVGLIGCHGSFEPILRCRELPPNDTMVAMFPNPKLVAYFVDPETGSFAPLAESGEFASSHLFSHKKTNVSVELSDKTGAPRLHLF